MAEKNKNSGVADNKSYHDMYHFNDNFFNTLDRPSLNVDSDINSTIKKNDEFSNVEIEKKEVVLQPDLSALFTARGKSHRQGGIDVYLKPGAFVFSDDKTLALNKKENEQFEFKYGGDFTPGKCTPAHTLKTNIDVEHYNRLVANLADPKKDDLAKKSSAMMLQKYISTLGNIAYLQEKKKGFPQGLPEFSIGTAPVYNQDVKENVKEQKQYAKYGGHIMASGGEPDPECPCGRLPNGHCVEPCSPADYQKLLPNARKVTTVPGGYKQLYQDPTATLYGKFDVNGRPIQTPGPKMSNEDWTAFINSPQGRATRYKRQGLQTAEDYLQVNPQFTRPPYGPPTDVYQPSAPPDEPIPQVPNLETSAQGVKRADWQFTPWQKISQGYNASKYALAQRYMPYRSRFTATYADPALLNEQQAVGSATAQANSQLSSLNTLNPILRNAQANSAYGQLLDKIPELGLQVENQNVGIKNQFRLTNNQTKNQETLQNIQNDQTYYQQSVVARQNFDNLRSYLGDQYMNNVMRDVETNQSLAYNLLTQNNPAYSYDWRTGNLTRNPKSILDVEGSGAQEELRQAQADIENISDPYQKAQARIKLYGLKVFGPAIQQQGLKKGGYKNPYL